MVIDIVHGHYKGQTGAVKDVNRYQVDPTRTSLQSGLVLTIERYVFTATASTQLVQVDYDSVRFHK